MFSMAPPSLIKTVTNQARNRSGFYPFTEIIEICHNNNSK